jgi:hypothetical protein
MTYEDDREFTWIAKEVRTSEYSVPVINALTEGATLNIMNSAFMLRKWIAYYALSTITKFKRK